MSYLPAVGTRYKSLHELESAYSKLVYFLNATVAGSFKMGNTSGSTWGDSKLGFHCSVRLPRKPDEFHLHHNTNYCSSTISASKVAESVFEVIESEESHTCPQDWSKLDAQVEMRRRLDEARSSNTSRRKGRKPNIKSVEDSEGSEQENEKETTSQSTIPIKRSHSAHGTNMAEVSEGFDDPEVSEEEDPRPVAKVSKRNVEMGPPQARSRSCNERAAALSTAALPSQLLSSFPPSLSFDATFAYELASFLRTFNPPCKDLSHDVALLLSAGVTSLETFMSILMMEESSLKLFVDMIAGDQKSQLPKFDEL